MHEDAIKEIIRLRFQDNLSYREIESAVGYSRTAVMHICKKHLMENPDAVEPVKQKTSAIKKKKQTNQGFRRGLSKKTQSMSDTLVDGYSVFAESKHIKCGKKECKICSDGSGHGPYIYLRCYNSITGSKTPIYIGADNEKNRSIIASIQGKSFKDMGSLLLLIKNKKSEV